MSRRETISEVVANLNDNNIHDIYVPLEDCLNLSVQVVMSDGVAADDITVHAFLTNDTAPTASSDWSPCDDIIFGTMANNTGIVNSAAAVSSFHLMDTQVVANGLKITYQRTSGAGGTSDVTIRVKRG